MSPKKKKKLETGVLNNREIKTLIDEGVISSPGVSDITEDQIQPASLDLRLGTKAYRVLSSFLAEKRTVQEKLDQPDMYGSNIMMYELDISEPKVLEKDSVYLIPLMEELNLPKTRYETISGRANPKSTTGRLDIFTRVITDESHRFDDIAPGYQGKLYLEVMPRSFPVRVTAGQTLVQLRLIRGTARDYIVDDTNLKKLHEEHGLLYLENKPLLQREIKINKGLYMSIDLSGNDEGIVGYKSKKNSHYVDLAKVGYYQVEEFWEPIYKRTITNNLILEPEDFYILASREKIRIPLGYASEMVPFEAGSGELRTHYAGFFDPGFGYGKGGEIKGTKAVLEVRARDVPFMVEDGQTFFKMTFEEMTGPPDKVYGVNIGSSYQSQDIKLSKHFKDG